MSFYDRIQSAFEERLEAFPQMPSGGVAWENVRFDPTGPETKWLRCVFDPVAASRRSAGDNGYSRADGFFLIWIYCPIGIGTSESAIIADALVEWFKSGTSLESGGEFAKILSAERGRGGIETDWWVTPIRISWYAHTIKV